MQSEIPADVMMNAERLYDDGGYKTVPEIIAEAVMAERERCTAALSAAEPAGEVAGQQGRYWMSNEGRWSNWFDITFNTWVPETGVREVRNIYAAPPAPVVDVKALEWREEDHKLIAGTDLTRYEISNVDDDTGPHFQLLVQHFGSTYARRETLEEVKGVAQSDFEARIRSALSAQVQDVADTETYYTTENNWENLFFGPGASTKEMDVVWDFAKQSWANADFRITATAAPAKQEG